jgi:hypothetical protein
MGVFYSDEVKSVFAPKVTKSNTRYDTKVRMTVSAGTHIRFMRSRDIVFNDETSTVHMVTPLEAYRPDIIAKEYYNDESYAWIILAANNLQFEYSLVSGMKILIPSIISLQGSNGKLVTR